MLMAAREPVCVGAFAGAHGVRGAVRVKSFTARPEDVAAYGAVFDQAGNRSWTLHLVGASRGLLIARVDGVEDREAAEALKGIRLHVPRAALPEPDEEEYYFVDLIGLAAELVDGSHLGRIIGVHELPAGDALEVQYPGGRSVLVPFTKAIVPEVDIKGGRVVIDPPEGLLDTE